ncbi:metallophosphoesterase [Streptomyces sp. WMMC500]|uniref:metallophosphoesterase family protein n=1 Tax=Streptomyces sp. WMMC500 TaxID=3015154 RepID=UPI00248BB664|nr:metallophosphoesterase [Streptomyces sp. WMMC500]WBB64104.1 metallophosphoesterase [Streptomyces sp. WMMC500]
MAREVPFAVSPVRALFERLRRAPARVRRFPAAVRRLSGRARRAAGRRRDPGGRRTRVESSLVHRPHPYARALGFAAVTVVGAGLGLLVVGGVETSVGPMDTRMALTPSATGDTRIRVAPLGAIDMDSHDAPLRLDVEVERLDPDRSRALVAHPEEFSGLEEEVTADIRRSTIDLGVRTGGAALVGATALGLAVYRTPRRALAAGGLALALLAASGAAAFATWNPKSVLEPKYSGLLTSAPSVIGDARSIVTEFDVYQQELARLVTNVSKLYDAASTLPAYRPDPSTVRFLHVSDMHLNPAAWGIIRSLVDQYELDAVIDTGDTMDHGSAAENVYLDPIATLGVPYVWVRGNHDSLTTQAAVAGQKNARVLDDGESVVVAGVRIAGIGDPQFTPDRSVAAAGDPAEVAAGERLAAALAGLRDRGRPADLAVAHNPVALEQVDGLVPLALGGHRHQRKQHDLPEGTRLMVEGSAGGGGLRAVEEDVPEKVSASVLYFDRSTRRLQAWDEITLGGLGLTSAEVSRHLVEENRPGGAEGTDPPAAPGEDS